MRLAAPQQSPPPFNGPLPTHFPPVRLTRRSAAASSANAFKGSSDSAEENPGCRKRRSGGRRSRMTRAIQRIGPLFPAVATAGASVCVSSLLLATGPQTLGPSPVVPPLTSQAGRIVASLSPPAHKSSVGRGRVEQSTERRNLSQPASASSTPRPARPRSSAPEDKGEASPPRPGSPSSPPPTPTPPVRLPEPTVTPPARVVQPATVNTKPGWGHGDANHVHTGPPGRASTGRKSRAASTGASTGAGTATAPDTKRGFAQDGAKKPTSPPGKGSNDRKDQATSTGAVPPPAAPDERGSASNGEKKSADR